MPQGCKSSIINFRLQLCLVMSRKRAAILHCPTCRKLVNRRDPEFPFCSERCRTIDLGKWASNGYVVSSPIGPDDEDSIRKILRGDDPETYQ